MTEAQKVFRVYVRRKDTMRLMETHWNSAAAREAAGNLALAGEWVKVTVKDDDQPVNRWD